MSFYDIKNNNNRPENPFEDLYYFERLENPKKSLESFYPIPPYLKKKEIINKIEDLSNQTLTPPKKKRFFVKII
mgnify:CR=1 FL=1